VRHYETKVKKDRGKEGRNDEEGIESGKQINSEVEKWRRIIRRVKGKNPTGVKKPN